MIVKFNYVDDIITDYFQKYKDVYRRTSSGKQYKETDLVQRSNNYGAIRNVLSNIQNHLGKTFIKNGRNYIEIPNIATVEYEIENNRNEMSVINIYFLNKQTNVNNVQQNNQKKQIQYQPVSQECFGMTMVKSNNGLFNFINRNKQ